MKMKSPKTFFSLIVTIATLSSEPLAERIIYNVCSEHVMPSSFHTLRTDSSLIMYGRVISPCESRYLPINAINSRFQSCQYQIEPLQIFKQDLSIDHSVVLHKPIFLFTRGGALPWLIKENGEIQAAGEGSRIAHEPYLKMGDEGFFFLNHIAPTPWSEGYQVLYDGVEGPAVFDEEISNTFISSFGFFSIFINRFDKTAAPQYPTSMISAEHQCPNDWKYLDGSVATGESVVTFQQKLGSK